MRTILLLASVGYVLALPLQATAQEQASTFHSQADWSRVLTLKPGAQIIVTVRGGQPLMRVVVRGEPSQLTVLNLTDPMVPRSVERVLLNLASTHPEAFASPHAARFVDRDVEVGPDGVFLDGRKITELRDVAGTIARDDIVEIAARQKGGGILGRLGPLGGYFAGAFAGGYIGALLCRCDSGFLPGMLAGGISGGVAGYRAAVRETERVIYRAP